MEFTADTLLRLALSQLEHRVDKHKKIKMHERAWDYALAVAGGDYATTKELRNIIDFWWGKHGTCLDSTCTVHVRASIGNGVVAPT